MADTDSKPPEQATSKAWTSLQETIHAMATLRLYEEHPFRALGLPVLAPMRDVSRRFDELKMGLELGTVSWSWSFARPEAASLLVLRSAHQRLKDPGQRLLAEFFWFWPETYPADGADPALAALAEGRTGDAVATWAGKSADESPVSLHNLAVYHHLMALEQEVAVPALPVEDKIAWWRASIRYWDLLQQNVPCWEKLRQRVVAMAEPQVPAELVDRLRAAMPELLSSLNAILAVQYAEASDTAGAARQVAMLGEFHADSAAARRALEKGAAPVIRRIEARIGDARRASQADPIAAAEAARSLVVHCLSDIRIIDTLCGRESEFFIETCTRLATAALDLMVSYQRATNDDAGCLALLVYLDTLPLFAETRTRVEGSFDVIFSNAVTEAASDSDEAADPGYARKYRVLREYLIPRLIELGLDDPSLRASCDQVAGMLHDSAVEACDERNDIAYALHMLDTRSLLPATEAVRERRSAERDAFAQAFAEEEKKQVRLERGEAVLEITRRGVDWRGEHVAHADITGLRCGVLPGTPDDPRLRHVVGWRTRTSETLLDSTNVFSDPETAPGQYAQVLEALYHFAVPRIVALLVKTIREGSGEVFGSLTFTPDGLAWITGPRVWKREHLVPYARVRHRLEHGHLILNIADNPRAEEKFITADTWNAAILGYVIDALSAS